MNKKNFLIGLGSIIGLILFFVVSYKLLNKPVQTYFPTTAKISSNDHVKWNKSAKNILTEYSDFECPACANFHSILNNIEKTATPNAVLVFRHFPLYQIHAQAVSAAYAAEAAGLQDKYWEMSDLLFESQDEWGKLTDSTTYFIDLAKKLSLNVDQFAKDLVSEQVKNKVSSNLAEAEKIGLNSTPTFFLNGKKLNNITSVDQFEKLLKSL